MPRVEKGFWLSLVDEHKGRVIYQCATDNLSDEEFMSLWMATGKTVLREMANAKETSLEFKVRMQKLT